MEGKQSVDTRACLKNHFCHLHNDAIASYSPLCVIFAPNSGYIAHYAPFIWHKSLTNCDAHLTESIFQTHSRARKWLNENGYDYDVRTYQPGEAAGGCVERIKRPQLFRLP